MKKFIVEVLMGETWLPVRPTNGSPYRHASIQEAQEFINTWYPEAFGRGIRIKEVVA